MRAKENKALVIRSGSRFFDLRLSEVWHYRDLLLLLVRRDFVSLYKQTVLGPLWYLARPLITALTYTVIFGYALNVSTDGAPPVLFFMCGVVPWSYFQMTVSGVSNAFVANMGIFGKVYFPRLIIPLSALASNLISLIIQGLMLAMMFAGYMISGADIHPTSLVLLFPVLFMVMLTSSLGIGLIVASLSGTYRDLIHLAGFGISLLMYLTPVVYPISLIPSAFRDWVGLNPMTCVIEGFRQGLLGSGSFETMLLIQGSAVSLVFLVVGLGLYSRVQDTLVDTI